MVSEAPFYVVLGVARHRTMLTWYQIAMAQEDLRMVGDKPWLTGYS